MATIEECRGALEKLSDNMRGAEGDVRAAAALDRSVSCRITDLDVTFLGRMTGGRIVVDETVEGPPAEKAQIRLTMAGDDLVALVGGELNFARAWGSGRVQLEASLLDLFRLRKLL
ncbi:sterol-binding protein [Streptomyces mangrovisoli]|uniref:Sterol-binding protein n=1 Tax=Streptomyces mangrovisoli TaxID=1428628 RepID=A0A1J4NQF0_9ACTN|nr:sterol-binding protein [Streptomyces mangrovisoli]OIJ64539.1 sterol-binding protein [Streptomyces mangrovisoli]